MSLILANRDNILLYLGEENRN